MRCDWSSVPEKGIATSCMSIVRFYVCTSEYHLFNDVIYGTLRYQIDKIAYLGMLGVDHDETRILNCQVIAVEITDGNSHAQSIP